MANQFANAIKEVNNAKLIAAASQNKSRLDLFSSKNNINTQLRFNNYESLASCKEIDAVYISTLNNTHADLINLFATNKKNILCEKPFCITNEESKKIKKLIDDNKIKFYEAIAYLSHPQTNTILDLIENDEIGQINNIKSEFGFRVRKINPKSRLFNKNLGGGAIFDLGCYPLSFISLFNKKDNKIIFNKKFVKNYQTNVDIMASANLSINNKINCEIKVSLEENLENSSIIYGSKGSLKITQPWLPEKKTFLEINSKKRYFKIFINSVLTVYAEQIKNVSNEFLDKGNTGNRLFNIDKSVDNMKYLNKWMNVNS